MRAPLRMSGIDVLGDIAWGSHFCLFYETKEDLCETLVPYFRSGLESNELCLWAVTEPLTIDEAKSALQKGIPDFDEHLAAGSIEVLPGEEWYINSGKFDWKRVTGQWNEKVREALSRGYEGVRGSGNALWFAFEHWKDFSEYENGLDKALASRPINLLCTYPLAASRAVDVMDVVDAHQFTLARRNGAWDAIEAQRPDSERDTEAQAAAATLVQLTPREREVLTELVLGARNKQIAHRLGIADRTVQVYRSRIMLKTKVRSFAELVRLALAAGIQKGTEPAPTPIPRGVRAR